MTHPPSVLCGIYATQTQTSPIYLFPIIHLVSPTPPPPPVVSNTQEQQPPLIRPPWEKQCVHLHLYQLKFQNYLVTFKFHLVECTLRRFCQYRQSLLSSWFTVLHNVSVSPCFSFIFGLLCRFLAVLHFESLFFTLISV